MIFLKHAISKGQMMLVVMMYFSSTERFDDFSVHLASTLVSDFTKRCTICQKLNEILKLDVCLYVNDGVSLVSIVESLENEKHKHKRD